MTDALEHLLAEQGVQQRAAGDIEPSPAGATGRRRPRALEVIVACLGGTLLLAGVGLGAATLLVPHQLEQAYGTAKTAITQRVQDVQEQVFDTLPVVTLSVSGGKADLDWVCNKGSGDRYHSFVHMTSYERGSTSIPPVWAAHNDCGGDVLLGWQVGQRIMIAGDDTVYEAVDIIDDVPKTWSTTADLAGLHGTFVLQSCFYGQDRMKFIGFDVAADQSHR